MRFCVVSLESGRTTVLTTHRTTKPSEGRVERGEGERGGGRGEGRVWPMAMGHGSIHTSIVDKAMPMRPPFQILPMFH